MRTTLIFVGLVVGTLSTAQVLGQTAGIVQFAAGDVKLVHADGAGRAVQKGVVLSVGDTLMTGAGALAQIKMGDGAVVMVQPESRLTVAEFHYAGVEDGSEKVRYRLERGGFRAVTGAIGRTHKANYLIETPIAHMGVRGTDHESYYFPTTGPVGADDAKPGAYNKVNTGMTFIRTAAGEVEIQPNQVGFVASAGEAPVILKTVPGFFNHSIAPRSARRPANPSAQQSTELAEVEQGVDTSNGVRLTRTRGPRVTPGSGNGQLVGFTLAAGNSRFGGSGNGVAFTANVPSPTDTNVGGDVTHGVSWHTWEGGVAVIDGNPTLGTTHFMGADPGNITDATDLGALVAGKVQATYTPTLSASGQPLGMFVSNYLAEKGTITKLIVDVDFGAQMVTNYALDVTVRADWSVNGSGSITQFAGPEGILLSGTCTRCTGATNNPASGTAHGTFVGSQAERLITTFGLTSASGEALSGAAYLKK